MADEFDFLANAIINPADSCEPVQLSETVVADPVFEFLQKVRFGELEPIAAGAPRTKLSPEFLARSDARFEKVAEQLRRFFWNCPEKLTEALDLVKQARKDIRAEFIGA